MKYQMVSNNVPEFCDVGFNSWLRKIGCTSSIVYVTSNQTNDIAERMVQTINLDLKATKKKTKKKIEIFLSKLLLSYCKYLCVPRIYQVAYSL